MSAAPGEKAAAPCCTTALAWVWVQELAEAVLMGSVDASVLAAAVDRWFRVCLEEARRGQ